MREVSQPIVEAKDHPQGRPALDRWTPLLAATLLVFLGLNALAVLRLMHGHAGTNSYVLQASSWLHGRLDVPGCWDTDCVKPHDLFYNIFPPFPSVVLVPFVAAFGTAFAGTLALSYTFYLLTAWLWWQIARFIGRSRDEAAWVTLAAVAGSPLYVVFLGADTVWFFAQICGFLLVTLALYATLRGWLVAAGVAIGAAFLCRQMSIFTLPFLWALAAPDEAKLWRIDGAAWRRTLRLGLPVLLAVMAGLAYNYARFGRPFDTGYEYIVFDPNSLLGARLRTHGLFSRHYLLYNVLYLFYQGPHVAFGGNPEMTAITGMDKGGAALLAASPWIFFLFVARYGREMIFGAVAVLLVTAIMLFYHSNGFVQYGVQRFTLDILPILLYALAAGLAPTDFRGFRVFVAWSVVLTAATAVLLAILKTAH